MRPAFVSFMDRPSLLLFSAKPVDVQDFCPHPSAARRTLRHTQANIVASIFNVLGKRKKAPVSGGFWRRGRDSNPRYGFPYTHFPGVRLRPLGHPSGSRFDETGAGDAHSTGLGSRASRRGAVRGPCADSAAQGPSRAASGARSANSGCGRRRLRGPRDAECRRGRSQSTVAPGGRERRRVPETPTRFSWRPHPKTGPWPAADAPRLRPRVRSCGKARARERNRTNAGVARRVLMVKASPPRPGASKSRGAFSSPQSASDRVSAKAIRAVSLSNSAAFQAQRSRPCGLDWRLGIQIILRRRRRPPRPSDGDPYSDGK